MPYQRSKKSTAIFQGAWSNSCVLVCFLLVMSLSVACIGQSANTSREEYKDLRKTYGQAVDALDAIDRNLKAKKYEQAVESLTTLVKLKSVLDKGNLPAAIKRSMSTWDKRMRDAAVTLAGTDLKLPASIVALKTSTTPPVSTKPNNTKKPTNSTKPPKKLAGNARFDVAGSRELSVDGRRQLADFESDAYGPLPFPEKVSHFIENEVNLLLDRQREDGSFAMIKRNTEAGGTVESVIMASMSGVSLRKHVEIDPKRIEPAIRRALDYVVYMVRSGKLRTNVTDAAWRYTYSLRFLVHEYPFVNEKKTRTLIEDACVLLLYELQDMQQGTKSQKAKPVRWQMRSPPGMVIDDDLETGRARVVECLAKSPAYLAGIREGDILSKANGASVATTLRYYIAQMGWGGGDTVELEVLRDGQPMRYTVRLPHVYPGVLGITFRDHADGGVTVASFEALSNATQASIKVDDRLISINGKKIENAKAIESMTFHSGESVKFELKREEKIVPVNLICVPIPAADFGIEIRGGIDQTTIDGFEVNKLSRDSCLAKVGLAKGDRLLRIDDTRVMNRRHFVDLERTIWGGKKVTVTYLKGSDRKKVTAEVATGSRPHKDWLKKGHHGLTLTSGSGGSGVMIKAVSPASPAANAGCEVGDRIKQINGATVTRLGDAQILLDAFSGQKCIVVIARDDQTKKVEWTATRPTESPWISNNESQSGGWVYYTYVRGGTTFLISDLLRILIKARNVLPIEVPERMISGPFKVLSNLRMTQPNSDVESYRYDAGGSFWNVRDMRGDVGRLNGAELACVIYCDAGMKHDAAMNRTQAHLAKSLPEWLAHRGILDLAKAGGHGKFSVAPWYWPYSYWTTLEAAAYLNVDDALKRRVQETALKAYFQYAEYKYLDDLEAEGYMIGYYPRKQLLRICMLLDGLATMKNLYRPMVVVREDELKQVMAKFNATQYGEASAMLIALQRKRASSTPSLKSAMETVSKAIEKRFDDRLRGVKEIHSKYPQDGLRHLREMKAHFIGYSRVSEIDVLEMEWAANQSKD